MRATFGLVGLLVTLGVILWIFKTVEAPALTEGKKAQDQAQQLSGRGADGASAASSITLEPHLDNGRLTSVDVTAIVPGGAMEQYYGLQQGDQIIEIVNVMPIRDVPLSDGEMAKALIAEAFQKQQQLIIKRGSETLPLPAPSPAPGSATGKGASSDSSTLSPAEKLLQRSKIPTH